MLTINEAEVVQYMLDKKADKRVGEVAVRRINWVDRMHACILIHYPSVPE